MPEAFNVPEEAHKESPGFLGACESGQLELVLQLLTLNPEEVNTVGPKLVTPLYLASKGGHTQVVKELLGRKARLEATTQQGKTPLWEAARLGHLEVVKVLTQAGANVAVKKGSGFQAGFTPLMAAALASPHQLQVVEYLVLNTAADVNARSPNGCTSFLIACQRNKVAVAQKLLELGADPEIRDKDGDSAFFLACHYKCWSTVQWMLSLEGDNLFISNSGVNKLLKYCQTHSKKGELGVQEILSQYLYNLHPYPLHRALVLSACFSQICAQSSKKRAEAEEAETKCIDFALQLLEFAEQKEFHHLLNSCWTEFSALDLAVEFRNLTFLSHSVPQQVLMHKWRPRRDGSHLSSKQFRAVGLWLLPMGFDCMILPPFVFALLGVDFGSGKGWIGFGQACFFGGFFVVAVYVGVGRMYFFGKLKYLRKRYKQYLKWSDMAGKSSFLFPRDKFALRLASDVVFLSVLFVALCLKQTRLGQWPAASEITGALWAGVLLIEEATVHQHQERMRRVHASLYPSMSRMSSLVSRFSMMAALALLFLIWTLQLLIIIIVPDWDPNPGREREREKKN